MKYSLDYDDTAYFLDALDGVLESDLHDLSLKDSIALQVDEDDGLSNETELANEPLKSTDEFVEFVRLGVLKLRPSLEDPPVIELKELLKRMHTWIKQKSFQ